MDLKQEAFCSKLIVILESLKKLIKTAIGKDIPTEIENAFSIIENNLVRLKLASTFSIEELQTIVSANGELHIFSRDKKWDRDLCRIAGSLDSQLEKLRTNTADFIITKDKVALARIVAKRAFYNKIYQEKPYIFHLERVAKSLLPYGEEAMALGYLHDILEVTKVSQHEIAIIFGDHFSQCIRILTTEEGASRQERNKNTFEKLTKVTEAFNIALIVKAADQLANIRECIEHKNNKMLRIYYNEYPLFYRAAHRNDLCNDLWRQISELLNKATARV